MKRYTASIWEDKYNQLINNGCCLVENVLSAGFLDELRSATDGLIDQIADDESQRQRTTGSMIPVVQDCQMAKLIAHTGAMNALMQMGLTNTLFQSGYIISKPPSSPRLFWHSDWGFWNHPSSYKKSPLQIFLMYYLTDTRPENGCLRVIPGSHINENPLHALLSPAHATAQREGQNFDLPEFQTRPDEADVKVKAGDLLVGDARLLHASHANNSDERRTLITLWYHPNFNDIPEELQAAFAARVDALPPEWPKDARDLYSPLLIRYDGQAKPFPFNRQQRPVPIPDD